MNFREKTYALREETNGGVIRYYVAFTDGQAIFHEVEVSLAVYRELERFARINRNLQAFDERHREYSSTSNTA